MQGIEVVVVEELLRVAELRGLCLPPVTRTQRLVDELGLRSLDLAHLVAALERRLRVDPFFKHVPITRVQTVGDLCDAYTQVLREAS